MREVFPKRMTRRLMDIHKIIMKPVMMFVVEDKEMKRQGIGASKCAMDILLLVRLLYKGGISKSKQIAVKASQLKFPRA